MRLLAAIIVALAAVSLVGAPSTSTSARVIDEPMLGLRLRWVPAAAGEVGFWLGESELSQAQWRLLMPQDPSVIRGDDLPVEWISWEEATELVERLAARTGRPYRLPTEAEWVRAASLGFTPAVAAGEAAYVHDRVTRPVGSGAANALGLKGMHDNAWEWCADRLGDDGSRHVLKGGTCNLYPRWCAIADRTEYPGGFRHERRGLRVALDAR